MPWTKLEEALARGGHRTALAVALELWRETRRAPLADLIDVLATRTPKTTLPSRCGKDAYQLAWLALARARDPVHHNALLAGLGRSLQLGAADFWQPGYARSRYEALLVRIAALADLPDDPRTSRMLVEVIRTTPWPVWDDAAAAHVYGPVLALIERTADERCLPNLRALVLAPSAPTRILRDYFERTLPPLVAALERAAATAPALTRTASDALVRVRAELVLAETTAEAVEDGDTLLARALRAPDDDGALRALEERLVDRGDPRGELITLQRRVADGLAGEGEIRRVRSLIRRHERVWLGDLVRLTKRRVFELGLLAEAELLQAAAAPAELWDRARDDERLATVRVLRKGNGSEARYRSFVLSPVMRSLREVDVCSLGMLEAICDRPEPWRLEHIRIERTLRPRILERLAEARSLPALREITFPLPPAEAEALVCLLARWPLHARLERLTAVPKGGGHEAPAGLAAWLRSLPRLAPMSAVAVALPRATVTARTGDGGLVVEVEASGDDPGLIPLLSAMGRVERITVRPPRGADDADQLEEPAAMASALRSLAPYEVELPPCWERQLDALA